MLYWPGVRLRWLNICAFIDPVFLLQGCALRKIEGSPTLWTCEIQCAQQMISVKSKDFLVAREQKLQMQAPWATEHSLVLVNKNAKPNEANIQPSWTNNLGQ